MLRNQSAKVFMSRHGSFYEVIGVAALRFEVLSGE